MNDRERELWVLNDEGLYNMFKWSRMNMRDYIKKNRDTLTCVINERLNKEPD